MHLMVHKNKKCCLMSLVTIRKRLTTSWRLAPFDARGNAVCHSLIPTFTATGN